MANRTVTLPAIWADSAPDVPGGSTPTTGVTYKNSNLLAEEVTAAWPFKTVVDSANTNEILYRLTAMMQMLELNGTLPWCATINYAEFAIVTGSNGRQYRATGATINEDPLTTPASWILLDDVYSSGIADIGVVKWIASSTVPSGHLECDGTPVLVSTYSRLKDVIYCGDALNPNTDVTFGYRTSSTSNPSANRTVNGDYIVLPNLQGEFIRGWDNGRGIDTGRVFASYQGGSLEPHTHLTTAVDNGAGAPDFTNQIAVNHSYGNDQSYSLYGSSLPATAGLTSSTGGTETRPRNIALMPIIKY